MQALLAIAVLGNFAVWFTEQLISLDFEILSLSYIFSELFLLGIHVILIEQESLKKRLESEKLAAQQQIGDNTYWNTEQTELFLDGMNRLTQTELLVFNLYTEGKRSKEILELASYLKKGSAL